MWFEALLRKVAFENPHILRKHLDGMFRMSEGIKTCFVQNGFVPLYAAQKGDLVETSIGPVISFTCKSGNGENVHPEALFDTLKSHLVLTTPLDEGIRLNSRGITEAGKRLLFEKMAAVKNELEKNFNNPRKMMT